MTELVIEDAEACQLAAELVELTGDSLRMAVVTALREERDRALAAGAGTTASWRSPARSRAGPAWRHSVRRRVSAAARRTTRDFRRPDD